MRARTPTHTDNHSQRTSCSWSQPYLNTICSIGSVSKACPRYDKFMPFYVVQVVTCIYTMPSWINAHKQQISINIPRECACPPTYTDNHSQGTGCPLTKKSEHVLFGGHFLCLETYCCKSKKTKNRNHLHYVPKGNYKHNYRKGVTLYSRN